MNLMSNILLAIIGWDPKGWELRFRALAPQHKIRTWPERAGEAADMDYACVWNPPHGVLAGFPNLKAIFSLGAGVDDLLTDPALPDVPIVRIVDSDLTMRMTEYVAMHVLMCHRRQRLYDAQQRERLWRDHDQPSTSEVGVGIMGLGELGASAASLLHRLGFRVAGWSRTKKALPGIETFAGPAGLEAFLRRTEILVCLLPSTPATRGLLDLDLFRKLRYNGALHGAYVINAGRGALQVDRRHHRGARGRHARGRDPRRLRDGAAAAREPALDAPEGDDHAAQRGAVAAARHRGQYPAADRPPRDRHAARARGGPAERILRR